MWPSSCYVKLQMSTISSNATAQNAPLGVPRLQTRPRLSIVILSAGSIDLLDRALAAVLETPFYLETELVVVRICRSEDEKTRLQRMSRQMGFVLELAPAHTSREVLAAQGASTATGDIVTLRQDVTAHDKGWLSAYVFPDDLGLWDGTVVADVEATDRIAGKASVGRAPLADRIAPPARPLGAPTWHGDATVEHQI